MSDLYQTFKYNFKQLGNQLTENCDIFGQTPTLRIMNKKKFTSGLGCCLTLLIGTLTLFYLTTQVITLYSKSQPRLVVSEQQIFDSTNFPLQNDNFTLIVTVADAQFEPIEGQFKYYNITINHCIRQRIVDSDLVTIQHECKQLPISECTQADFDNDLQLEFFKNTRLGVMQCINREYLHKTPPVLQGQFSGSLYQYLTIQMETCQNSSTYQGCASQEEIQQKLQVGYYAIYSSNYLMQLNNPQIPFSQFINMDYYSFTISTSKTIKSIYRIQETHTDDGIFFQNNSIILNIKRRDALEQTDLYNKKYLVSQYIYLDYLKTINERSYIKMQTILGQVGGFWQIFIVAAQMLFNPLINGLMMIRMANELYRFKNPNSKQMDEKEIQQYFEQSLNPNYSDQRLNLNFFQSFLLLGGCYKSKQKVFTIAKEDILQKLDIIKIIQRAMEINKIKHILLNDEQCLLFDLLPKPLIQEHIRQPQLVLSEYGLDYKQILVDNSNNNQKSNNKIKDYLTSFQQVQQAKSNIDEKILQMMDKNIRLMFEQYVIISQRSQINFSELEPYAISEPQIQKPL